MILLSVVGSLQLGLGSLALILRPLSPGPCGSLPVTCEGPGLAVTSSALKICFSYIYRICFTFWATLLFIPLFIFLGLLSWYLALPI